MNFHFLSLLFYLCAVQIGW